MGRRDAVQFTLELAAEWRRLGARVTFEPGWETRGNGLSANYEGAVIHHTGFLSSPANPNPARNTLIKGRVDLKGPLCNSTGPWCADDDPWIHIIAAHPANHAGASGGRGTAPFPVTSLFNPVVWGHETDYGGVLPMSAGQRKAALIVGRGVTNVLRKNTDWIKAHAETSVTGKWDPGYASNRTIDMAAFRRDASQITEMEPDMPWNETEWTFIKVMNGKLDRATMAAEGAWKMLAGDLSDGKDRLAEIWERDGLTQEQIDERFEALEARVAGAGDAPAGAGQAFDYAELAKYVKVPSAAEIAAEVVALQNQQARDGDPATGPVS